MSTPQEEMVEIRCRACHRYLGVGPADYRIYCDDSCAVDYPASLAEDRDSLIEAVFQATSRPKTFLAEDFEISRQRIEQILMGRSYYPDVIALLRARMEKQKAKAPRKKK